MNSENNFITSFLESSGSLILDIILAVVALIVGFIAAKYVRKNIGKLKLDERIKKRLGSAPKFGEHISGFFYYLILLFTFMLVLSILEVEEVLEPLQIMFSKFIGYIPNIIGAIVVLGVAFIAGKFLIILLVELLKKLEADKIPEKLELQSVVGKNFSLSKVAGNFGFFFIMFFAVITAFEQLGMTEVATVLSNLLDLAGKILLGVTILAFGNFFANVAYKFLSASKDSKSLATIARYLILALVLAIGLNAMGLADTIVHLAFGISLGAVAIAFALSFGLGGREAAAKHMEYLLEKLRSRDKD